MINFEYFCLPTLYVKDISSDVIHMVGTDAHDRLYLDANGNIQYLNLQSGGGTPDDTGIFQFDFKTRRLIKNNFYGQWNHDVDHLFFARVDCCNDDIFEWNKEMHQEMQTILRDMQNRHYYPILIVIHKDQPKEYCHFHILLDYIDPDVKP